MSTGLWQVLALWSLAAPLRYTSGTLCTIASGHSGELGLLAAIWIVVLFWLILIGGCLVLASLALVPLLAIDPDNLKSLD